MAYIVYYVVEWCAVLQNQCRYKEIYYLYSLNILVNTDKMKSGCGVWICLGFV